jgi:hypothetical protein
VLAHARATPFQPVLELLRDVFGIRVKDPVEVSRRRVIDRFASIAFSEQALLLLLDSWIWEIHTIQRQSLTREH